MSSTHLHSEPITGGYGLVHKYGHRLPHRQKVAAVVLSRSHPLDSIDAVSELIDRGSTDIFLVQRRDRLIPMDMVHAGVVVVPVDQDIYSPGTIINTMARLVPHRHFLVSWDDYRLASSWESLEAMAAKHPFATLVPTLRVIGGDIFPSLVAPSEHDGMLRPVNMIPSGGVNSSLYPYDYLGVYDKILFRDLQGYDQELKPYWQKLDYGFRCFMWGSKIAWANGFRMDVLDTPPPEDSTPDDSYLRFFLKNLAIDIVDDHGVLQKSQYWKAMGETRSNPFYGGKAFNLVRTWVEKYKYKFVHTAYEISQMWDEEPL